MMVTRMKLFFNFDKEEKWLASMAAEGFELVGKGRWSRYRFRPSAPGDAVIRIDYRLFKGERDFVDYKALFEDSGWKHVAGGISSGAQYFEKVSDSADDDIFSDLASKAGRYRRLSDFALSLAAAWLPLMVVVLTLRHANFRAFLNPRLLYETPGLWEKTAADFWGAFLFETPFALLRGIALLVFPVFIAIAFGSAICANVAYRKSSG